MRRDPTAHERLKIIRAWQSVVQEQEVEKVSELPTSIKKSLEKAWAYGIDTIKNWISLEATLREYVAKHRLGERGLRVFGSNERTSKKSQAQGCRIRVQEPGVASRGHPLERVYGRLRKRFELGREYNSEVRGKAINTRLLYELEYERDKEMVLAELKRPEHLEYVLDATREKLSFFPNLESEPSTG